MQRACFGLSRRWCWLASALVLAVLVFANVGAGAASAAAQEVGAVDIKSGTMVLLRDLFWTSPRINAVIILLSVLSLGLFLYFLWTINPAAMVPAAFVEEVRKLISDGKPDQAAEYCRTHGYIFSSSIMQRCVENAGKPQSVILEMLDAEGRRRADLLWNRISYLADVSSVAPMLGLLGTVVGMIHAFFLLESVSASVNSRVLSNGVGQAMATTMFGLIVGILSLVFYSIIKGQTTRALGEVERVVHSVADQIKRGEP